MSKIFSVVELETNTGIRDQGLMGGIPDREDVENSMLYLELLEDCGDSDYIKVKITSYRYGDGKSEPASDDDLQWIDAQPDFINSNVVITLQDRSFTILHPDRG